jgi:SAM-dependent methyltransferase
MKPTTAHLSSNNNKRDRIRKALVAHAKDSFNQSATRSESTSTLEPNDRHHVLVAPISPTPSSILDACIPRLILNSSSRVVELGCGDGRWIISLSEKFHCKCIGIEIDEERLALAKEQLLVRNLLKDEEQRLVQFQLTDIFEYLQKGTFMNCDLVIMYLFREAMKRISAILKEKGLVTTCNIKGDHDTPLIQLLCVGFILPSFVPVWQWKIDGRRVYLYHFKKSKNSKTEVSS